MFKDEVKEIMDLVFEICDKTNESVFCDYDTDSKLFGVTTNGRTWVISNDKHIERNAQECKLALKKMLKPGVTNLHLEALKELNSADIAECINDLLQELKHRGDYILDYENPDETLDHIEYHAAEGKLPWGKIRPATGDGSDNLYCFFKEVPEC